MTITIAPVTLEHQAQWADLLAVCFDRQHVQMRKLHAWLCNLHDLITWGAWDGEKLVAQYTAMMRPVRTPQGIIFAGMSINMAVHPDYRGQGLVKQVSAPVYEQVRACKGLFGVGFSNAEGVKVDRHSKSYGYQVVGRLQSRVYRVHRGTGASVHLSKQFPDGSFCELSSPTTRHHFPKSVEYLRKRYADHPFREYHYGVWYEDDHVRGLVVYRPVRIFGVNGVALLDVYGNDLPELLAGWNNALAQAGSRFVHVLGSPSMKGVFSSQAFTLPYQRTPYYLTVKPFDDHPHLLNLDTWEVIGGDIL